MAIVNRNGRSYAYRSVRRDGRVTSEYFGCNESTLRIESMIAEFRDERIVERSLTRLALEVSAIQESRIVDYFDRVEELARAALYASGYHQHRREWRKRRGQKQAE